MLGMAFTGHCAVRPNALMAGRAWAGFQSFLKALQAISARAFAMRSGICFAMASRSRKRMPSFSSCGYVRTSIRLSIGLTLGEQGFVAKFGEFGLYKLLTFM